MTYSPDSIRIAMVETQFNPEPELALTHKIRQSSRPMERPHMIGTIYLLNRSDESVTVEVRTGGYVTNDDALENYAGKARVVVLEPRSALFLETADERSGDFEYHIWYSVAVPLPDGTRATGTFAVRRYARHDFDTYEDDLVLGVNARIIAATDWWPRLAPVQPA